MIPPVSPQSVPKPRPILFLDIDGVLNTVASLAEGVHLLPEKALLVRDFCEATGAKLVISSAWRAMFEERVLRFVLGRVGLRCIGFEWGGYVCEDRGVRRPKEIANYVEAHGITHYVILDDEDWDWFPDQRPRFVQTPVETGITRKHVADAIAILRGETPIPEPTCNFTAAEALAEMGGA